MEESDDSVHVGVTSGASTRPRKQQRVARHRRELDEPAPLPPPPAAPTTSNDPPCGGGDSGLGNGGNVASTAASAAEALPLVTESEAEATADDVRVGIPESDGALSQVSQASQRNVRFGRRNWCFVYILIRIC